MTRINFKKILEYAYYNDFVDTLSFKKKILDRFVEIGLLEYKYDKGIRSIYWITQNGVDYLKRLEA